MYQMNPPQPAVPPEMPRDKKRLSVPQIMLIVLTLAFAAWYLITTLTPEPARFATITADTISMICGTLRRFLSCGSCGGTAGCGGFI